MDEPRAGLDALPEPAASTVAELPAIAGRRWRWSAILALTLLGLAAWRIRAVFPPASQFAATAVAHLLVLALVTAGLVGWGALLLRCLGWRTGAYFSTAWSAGALLSGTMLGSFWWLRFPPRWAILAWLLGGTALLWRRRAQIRVDRLPSLAMLPGFRLWGWLFLAPPLLLAMAPALSLDSLVYHLAMPAQYALAGHAFEMPWNAHSYFPQLTSAVFALAMTLGGPSAAQLLHLGAAVLALAVVARIGARLVSPAAGAWAALLLASIPALNLPAGWAWNDWFVVLFLACALELCIEEGDHRRAGTASGSLALPRTLFAVGAAAVKYHALPALVLVGWRGRSVRQRLGQLALVLGVLAPWYGKNWMQTGNPLWPLGSGNAASERLLHYRGESSLAALPSRLMALFGDSAILDESLGIVFLVLAPLLLLAPASRRWLPLWLLGGIYAGLFLVSNPSVRIFSPLLLVLALGIGAGLAAAAHRPAFRNIGVPLVHALLLVNWLQIAYVTATRYEPLAPALGFQERDVYLASAQKYWPGFRWLAQHAAPQDCVLVVGESRILYLPRPAIAGTYLDPHPLTHFLREGCDEACLEAELKRAGVRWVYWDRSRYWIKRGPPPAAGASTNVPPLAAGASTTVPPLATGVSSTGPPPAAGGSTAVSPQGAGAPTPGGRLPPVGAPTTASPPPAPAGELVFAVEPLADAMFQQLLRRCGEERFRDGPRSVVRLCV